MREEKEMEYTRALLVGLDRGTEPDFDHSMEELKSLAQAAGRQVAGVIVQHMEAVNKAFYIGTGKVAQVREYARECQAAEVIFDNTLSPSQVRNLGKELELPVLDRTNLILDIFAIRARTREAKLQVETARLQYFLPRLVGMRENLSRQYMDICFKWHIGGYRRHRSRRGPEQQRSRRDKTGTGQAQDRTAHF